VTQSDLPATSDVAVPAEPPVAPPAVPAPAIPAQAGPAHHGQHMPPLGKTRSTGICILLAIVTFGIYPLYWYFSVHEEMKKHSGHGLGGVVALLLAIFVGIAMPYLSSSEVGQLYARRGMRPPVTGMTGLWYFPGIFLLVGPIIWFVKTNGALNAYWRGLGAQ
jgi:hypothetical protein